MKHLYGIGKTGTGKSTFLQNEILKTENGFCLLDPHGDLAEAVADRTPCIYFAPPDISLGFNVLDNVPEGRRHLVAESIVSAFRAIWQNSWGPNLEDVLRCSVLLLLDNPGTSLIDIPRLLSEPDYRTRLALRAVNPEVRRFWNVEFLKKSQRQQADELRSTQNKVRQFAIDPTLRAILAAKTTLRPERIMAKRQRLVVNLSKGKLGETPSHLLGALLVSAFYQAAEQRTQRVPFTLFADEFQNFATETFGAILSEARKYQLRLVLFHQFLGQLPETLQNAVFGNIADMISFRVGAKDAPMIAKELDLSKPTFLTDLSDFHYFRRRDASSIATEFRTPPPPPSLGMLMQNKANTLSKHTRGKS
jgi:type IV secretory pathway TraG/TraD family ATPase VirD4